MRNLFFLLLLLATKSFSQILEGTADKIDLKKYRSLPLHPDYAYESKGNTRVYRLAHQVVTLQQDSLHISVSSRHEEGHYTEVKLYSNTTKLYLRQSLLFHDFCIGSTKVYNEAGLLIDTIDCDNGYLFG